jgi:hypothetical protein
MSSSNNPQEQKHPVTLVSGANVSFVPRTQSSRSKAQQQTTSEPHTASENHLKRKKKKATVTDQSEEKYHEDEFDSDGSDNEVNDEQVESTSSTVTASTSQRNFDKYNININLVHHHHHQQRGTTNNSTRRKRHLRIGQHEPKSVVAKKNNNNIKITIEKKGKSTSPTTTTALAIEAAGEASDSNDEEEDDDDDSSSALAVDTYNSNSATSVASSTANTDQIQTRSSLLRAKLLIEQQQKPLNKKSTASSTASSTSSLFKKTKMMKKSDCSSNGATARPSSSSSSLALQLPVDSKQFATTTATMTPSSPDQIKQEPYEPESEGAEAETVQHLLGSFVRWSMKTKFTFLDQLLEACPWQCIKHVHNHIEPKMQRDYVSELPRELCLLMLTYVRPRDLNKLAQVNRYWREAANDSILWKSMCKAAGVNLNSSSEAGTVTSFSDLFIKSEPTVSANVAVAGPSTALAVANPLPSSSPYNYLYKTFNPYKRAYYIDYNVTKNWCSRPIPAQTSLRAHDDHVITCLKFDGDRILSGSDDNTLKVWCARTGKLLHTLAGHTVSQVLSLYNHGDGLFYRKYFSSDKFKP